MAKEKQTCENSSGSRLRDDVSKIFDCFLIINRPSGYDSDLTADYKYPADFDDMEILQQSLLFCFPFDPNPTTLVSFKDARNHFTFILTDIEGKHRFGFCNLVNEGAKCYCLLSFVPWFEIFYKILNYAHELSSQSDKETMETMLMEIQQQVLPEPNQKIQISATLTFQVPDANDLPSIPENRNLSEYYAACNTVFMMDVFASLMFERRIIFTSDSLSVLTSCVHSAEALLRPLHWQHIFIPVMPPHLLDYCLAPMPYLVGVHSSLMQKVRDMIAMDDDIIVANIDTEEIESAHNDLERIPNDVLSFFKSLLRKPTVAVGTNLALAFLRTQARLIGGYRNGLTFRPGEAIFFDENKFIESNKSNTAKEFARGLVQLQTFKQFVDGRLDMLNAGIGFRDTFENEVNIFDAASGRESDTYKEWLSAAKKGGNKLIMQFQKKLSLLAKDNLKGPQQSTRNYVKQQQLKQQSSRKKSLDETTHRVRPSRPPPISPRKLEELRTLQQISKHPPPRPPLPQHPPPKPPIRKKKSVKRTRYYNTLDADDDDNIPSTGPVLDVASDRERSMSNATYSGVDVDILADMQQVMEEKITILNSPTNASDTQAEADLLHFSGPDDKESSAPQFKNVEYIRQMKKRTSSEIRRRDHVKARPDVVITAQDQASYSSDEQILDKTPDVLDSSGQLVDLMSAPIETQKIEQTTTIVRPSAADDLLGLDFTLASTQLENPLKDSAFNNDATKPKSQTFSPSNPFFTPVTTSSVPFPATTSLNPSPVPDATRLSGRGASSSPASVSSSPTGTPKRFTPNQLNVFNTNSANHMTVSAPKPTNFPHFRQQGLFANSTSSDPVLNPPSKDTHSNIKSPVLRSLSNQSGFVKNNPFVVNQFAASGRDATGSTNPFHNSSDNRNQAVWRNPNTAKSLGNGGLPRGGSLKQTSTRNEDPELFSDLLGSWKSREGL